MAQRVMDVRAGLPSGLRRSGSVAVAEIDIPGIPKQMAAHSQISDAGRGLIGSGNRKNGVSPPNVFLVGRRSKDVGGGHIDPANGKPVIAAGEVKILNGKVKYIDNTSGHYEPSGPAAQAAAEKAFSQKGLDVNGTYIEKIWLPNPSKPSSGAWVPKK